MNEETQQDDVSLIELFAVLWHRKVMIGSITLAAVIVVVVISIISLKLPPEKNFLPNVYTPKALMLINDSSSAGGDISSMLGVMGGLAGVNIPKTSTNSALAIFITGTNTMLDMIVDEFDLIKRYNIDKFFRASSRTMLKNLLKAEYDEKSGVLTISFTDIDPVFAQAVVNYSVSYLEKRFDALGLDKNKIEKENLEANIASTFQEIEELENETRRLERSVASFSASGRLPVITADINRISMELATKRQVYTQLKVQYELLKVNMASEKPTFQILELAEIPDQKSGPSRGMLCIIVTFAAGFFAVFLAFVLNAVAKIKSDPVAMAKLRGKNE